MSRFLNGNAALDDDKLTTMAAYLSVTKQWILACADASATEYPPKNSREVQDDMVEDKRRKSYTVQLTADELDEFVCVADQPENFPDILRRGDTKNHTRYGDMMFRLCRSVSVQLVKQLEPDHVSRRRRSALGTILRHHTSVTKTSVGPYPIEYIISETHDFYCGIMSRLTEAVRNMKGPERTKAIAKIQKEAEEHHRQIQGQAKTHRELIGRTAK